MGLFSKKKVDAPPAPPLHSLLSTIDTNLRKATGSIPSGKSSIGQADPFLLRTWLLEKDQEIVALYIHTGTAEPTAGIFFPSRHLGKSLAEGLKLAETFAQGWVSAFPEPFKQSLFFSMKMDTAKPEAAIWPFLELEIYQIIWNGKKLFLSVRKDLRGALDSLPKETAGKAHVSDISKPDTSADTSAERIYINRPHDFIALDSFIPQSVRVGKNRLIIEKTSFSIVPGTAALEKLAIQDTENTPWFLASYQTKAQESETKAKISFLCAVQNIPQRAVTQEEPGQDPSAFSYALCSAVLQEGMKIFAETTHQSAENGELKKLSLPPDLSRSESILLVRATVSVSSFFLPFFLAAPLSILSPLLRTDQTAEASGNLPPKPIAQILSLNAKSLTAAFNANMENTNLRGRSPFMGASELLAHLSGADYALVLQNCLISNLSSKNLPALFFYNEKFAGENGEMYEKIIPLVPVDFNRLTAHMSGKFREEFTAYCGELRGNTLENCISINLEEMKKLETMLFYKRIAVTDRVRFLVREYFHKPYRAQGETELQKLKTVSWPFTQLKEMKPVLAQKALNRLDDRDAAMAILDTPEEKETFRRFISAGRLTRLEEERVFLRGRYDAEEIGPDDILKAKKLLSDTCREISDEAKKDEEKTEEKKALP